MSERFEVAATRLGWLNGRGVREGDIKSSYSADRIAMGQPIREPFRHDGAMWVCIGTMTGGPGEKAEAKAYRLLPLPLFEGDILSYRERTKDEVASNAGRSNPMGFYHGITVKYDGQKFVLSGPEAVFIGVATLEEAPEPGEQFSLFGGVAA